MTLNKLLTNGISIGIFEVIPICEINKSPTKVAKTEVIDFDKTKEFLIETFNKTNLSFNQPKSCDALKIIPDKEIIDFIGADKIDDYYSKLAC